MVDHCSSIGKDLRMCFRFAFRFWGRELCNRLVVVGVSF